MSAQAVGPGVPVSESTVSRTGRVRSLRRAVSVPLSAFTLSEWLALLAITWGFLGFWLSPAPYLALLYLAAACWFLFALNEWRTPGGDA